MGEIYQFTQLHMSSQSNDISFGSFIDAIIPKQHNHFFTLIIKSTQTKLETKNMKLISYSHVTIFTFP